MARDFQDDGVVISHICTNEYCYRKVFEIILLMFETALALSNDVHHLRLYKAVGKGNDMPRLGRLQLRYLVLDHENITQQCTAFSNTAIRLHDNIEKLAMGPTHCKWQQRTRSYRVRWWTDLLDESIKENHKMLQSLQTRRSPTQ